MNEENEMRWKVRFEYGISIISLNKRKNIFQKIKLKLQILIYDIYSYIYKKIDRDRFYRKMEGWE